MPRYKIKDKKTGLTHEIEWTGVGKPTNLDIRKIIDEQTKIKFTPEKEEPSLWEKANTPIIGDFFKPIRPALDSFKEEHPIAGGIGEFAGEALGSMTSPLSVASLASTGGASLLGRAGRISKNIQKGIGAATAVHGGYKASQAESLPELAGAGLEVGAGLLGMKSYKPVTPLTGALEPLDDIAKPVLAPTLQKLKDAVDIATPLNKKNAIALHNLNLEKAGKLSNVAEKGKEGFISRLRSLSGTPDKLQFTPPQLDDIEVNELYDVIAGHPSLTGKEFEIVNAQSGLNKILQGKVPQEHELKLLRGVYGPEFVDSVARKLPFIDKTKSLAVDMLNAPRGLVSSLDLGAPFRQALPLIHKKQFWTSFDDAFKAFGSEQGYDEVMHIIKKNPNYELATKSRLALTDTMNTREEQFLSKLIDKVPGVKASNRAHVAFLNKTRMDVFDDLMTKAQKAGNADPYLASEVANFINISTGRGGLGELERAAPILNGLFFSPRLMSSRLQVLTYPARYATAPPEVRKESLKSLLAMGAFGTSVAGLASAAGADVSLDPNSADFGKVKIGETRFDMWGGFQQYVKLASQLQSGLRTSTTTGKTYKLGEGITSPTKKDIIYQFLESKEAPIASFITTMLEGKDQQGNKAELSSEIVKRLIPIIAQDLYAIAEEDPELLPIAAPSSFFGIGVTTYKKKKSRVR